MIRSKKVSQARRKEGSALLIALLALAGLSILGLSLMLVTETELQVSNDERLRKQALYAAEAGIEHALVYLRGLDAQVYGLHDSSYGTDGVLSGDPNGSNRAGSDPPDEARSYDEPIVDTNGDGIIDENLYDPSRPWRAPALARKGNILYFCVSCQSPTPWFKANAPKPAQDYSMFDIPFEASAGIGNQWAAGTFPSRYTVYVKNNLDDSMPTTCADVKDCPPNLTDNDQALVLTSEGIVDVKAGSTGRGGMNGIGYKVVRAVEVTVKSSFSKVCVEDDNVGSQGGTGNSTRHCEDSDPALRTARSKVVRAQDWR